MTSTVHNELHNIANSKTRVVEYGDHQGPLFLKQVT